MQISIQGIDSVSVAAYRNGAPDANHQAAIRTTARGRYNPCRHCLGLIEEGEEILILAYCPFPNPQPYAEVGPIFLHANNCAHYHSREFPAWYHEMAQVLIRGYSEQHWIRYDTGKIVSGAELATSSAGILQDEHIPYIHVRTQFNCFLCRVQRAD